ncbi:GDSL esterase/lipase At2g03980-like isoform X2 [Papaver somniferum]|uniref:GDSL esterase/lipase At2g03980-like isoform X2 n=1 Tax=Papaver somniferum TaxID=3469 RepID=UPI000E6FC320|nr:GDSL esterase/lipase At2g03980-like isoform X2 [Papaver somniferum]
MHFSFAFILNIISFFLLIQSHQISGKQSSTNQGPVVAPALYVFGDSLVDSGNNNYLQTLAKANYLPYGVDFPNGSTGRFTNGKTTVDFFAEWLGLPYVPPYLGLSEEEKSKTITGINYASGASGILPETGTLVGDTLCLEE